MNKEKTPPRKRFGKAVAKKPIPKKKEAEKVEVSKKTTESTKSVKAEKKSFFKDSKVLIGIIVLVIMILCLCCCLAFTLPALLDDSSEEYDSEITQNEEQVEEDIAEDSVATDDEGDEISDDDTETDFVSNSRGADSLFSDISEGSLDNVFVTPAFAIELENNEEYLVNIADSVGIDEDDFADALYDYGNLEAIDRDMTEAYALEVYSTPTVFVNGREFSYLEYSEDYERVIEKRFNDYGYAEIEVYVDYECPFCQNFHYDYGQNMKEYADQTPGVTFAYRQFPLLSVHDDALWLAIGAETAEQFDKKYEYSAALFEDDTFRD